MINIKVEINGKEYELTTDCRIGTERRYLENQGNFDYFMAYLCEILSPPPTVKEIEEWRKSDMQKLLLAFNKLQKKEQSDFKKKLSR